MKTRLIISIFIMLVGNVFYGVLLAKGYINEIGNSDSYREMAGLGVIAAALYLVGYFVLLFALKKCLEDKEK